MRVNIPSGSYIKHFSLFDISKIGAIKSSQIRGESSSASKAIRRNIKWKDYKLVSLIAKLYVRMLNDEYRLSYKIKIYEDKTFKSLALISYIYYPPSNEII